VPGQLSQALLSVVSSVLFVQLRFVDEARKALSCESACCGWISVGVLTDFALKQANGLYSSPTRSVSGITIMNALV
jgi:hypothetical protein